MAWGRSSYGFLLTLLPGQEKIRERKGGICSLARTWLAKSGGFSFFATCLPLSYSRYRHNRGHLKDNAEAARVRVCSGDRDFLPGTRLYFMVERPVLHQPGTRGRSSPVWQRTGIPKSNHSSGPQGSQTQSNHPPLHHTFIIGSGRAAISTIVFAILSMLQVYKTTPEKQKRGDQLPRGHVHGRGPGCGGGGSP